MKILLLTAMYPTPENPAYGSFIRAQVEWLLRAGIDLEVLVIEGPPKVKYLRGLCQLRRRLAADCFDLVHAHFSYPGLLARMQRRVPVVVTYHGDDLLGTVGEHGRKTWWSAPAVFAGRMLARSVDAAIVQTAEMAGKLGNATVFVIPHEVDLDVFRPSEKQQARAELGLAADKRYLLFAADPGIPVKRFPLARAVADSLAQEDPAVELLVVCKETQPRLALYMSACDALLFPSYQEGSPNIIKQAMACNLPIVATDVGDVRQVTAQTEGCFVCRPDVAEFAACVRKILQRDARPRGRDHVRHLAGPNVARQVIAVYEHVLSARAARVPARAQASLPAEE